MIEVKNNVTKFEGTPKELSMDLTQIIIGFHNVLIKEFDMSSNEARQVVAKCGEIAFMPEDQLSSWLTELQKGDD